MWNLKKAELRNRVKWWLPGPGMGERCWSKNTNFQLEYK